VTEDGAGWCNHSTKDSLRGLSQIAHCLPLFLRFKYVPHCSGN